MQNLSPRHVKTEESLRLGVVSGWYSTKVSGTFVSGPHDTEADCLRKIAEINPPPAKGSKGAPVMSIETGKGDRALTDVIASLERGTSSAGGKSNGTHTR